ncbi:methyltransferase, partial [Acinetobacter baumannii]
ADLADPLSQLRARGGGRLSGYWRYAEHAGDGDGDQVAPYSRLMAASQALIADHVTHAYRFAQHQRMMDVGGGEGRFIRAV